MKFGHTGPGSWCLSNLSSDGSSDSLNSITFYHIIRAPRSICLEQTNNNRENKNGIILHKNHHKTGPVFANAQLTTSNVVWERPKLSPSVRPPPFFTLSTGLEDGIAAWNDPERRTKMALLCTPVTPPAPQKWFVVCEALSGN